MKKYRVRYDATKTFGFAYETIEARGIVHAFKLAKDHLREMKKITSNQSIKIASLKEEQD